MERKGRLHCRLLTEVILLQTVAALVCGCMDKVIPEDMSEVTISFRNAGFMSKAAAPDEDLIKDVSIMIFNPAGEAEECLWLKGRDVEECKVRLLKGVTYTFCACGNFGRQIYADDIEELEELTCHLAYPDEYREGIPMYAMKDIKIEGDSRITLPLTRLMAKISLRMDRSRLSENVTMKVRSVRIGNCPRRAKVFTESSVRGQDDCFPVGFLHDALDASDLNINDGKGISREVSLYMLENMQGEMDDDISDDSGKVFDENDSRRDKCSYIEMEIEYKSDEKYSYDKCLIYRFYLGEDRNNLDIERNCHYHITVSPEDDGLSEDSWRVDKTGLLNVNPSGFAFYPSGYIRGDIGEKVHIWCEFSPKYATFDVGQEYMEEDKARGIYDYEIDEDGHGAVLTLTGPGRGLIYMEAGDPVNDAALFIIEVNLP